MDPRSLRVSPISFVACAAAAIVAGGVVGMSMVSVPSRSASDDAKLGNVALRRPLVSVLPSAAAVSPSVPPRPPDADSLVADARAAYRSAATYADSTTVDDEFAFGDSSLITHVEASHAFDRKAKAYRFEFTTKGPAGDRIRFVMWERDGAVKTWADDAKAVFTFPSLERALSNPTGVSHGASTTVPGLLRDDVRWTARGLLGRVTPPLVVVGVDRVDGVDCWVIDGKPNKSIVDEAPRGQGAAAAAAAQAAATRSSVASLWIGRDDRLVHRYEARGPRGAEVIAVKPALNEAMPSSTFEFTPPP